MEKKKESIHPDQWLQDLPAQSEIQGFRPEEMLVCDKCQRKSPPTRLKCFYCGAGINVSAEQIQYLKPRGRKLEEWEKGFNVIYLPMDAKADSTVKTQFEKLVPFELDQVESFFAVQKPLPLARLESKIEAEVFAKQIHEIGLETKIISDEQLRSEISPKRLRGIEFFEEKVILILFNADEIAEIPLEDIGLIVVGGLFERKIESQESLKKKDARKVLESSEISHDEMLVDLYPRFEAGGYRIETKGFDFSCLGREKGLFAKDNLNSLAERLRLIAPNAKFDNDYLRLRALLGKVWEVSQRNDSSGVQRKGMGKFNRTNTITINNLAQFTRYSRLQWHNL